MKPRVAIPMPHSSDHQYAERSIPQYEQAVRQAGGDPVRIPLTSTAEAKKIAQDCDAVLLPGSNADVNPEKFGAPRSPHTALADELREAIDFMLLEQAYQERKPVLGICYGLQSLNVFRGGGLVQHIPEFLPEAARARVDHEAGKSVTVAHQVKVTRDSRLYNILHGNGSEIIVPVNSSHHQSADRPGNGLRIVGRCAEDEIIEALEGTDPHHFVVAVQWHPERSVALDQASPALFNALIEEAAKGR